MKSNTTHHPPKSPTEDLGDGTYYYNFDIVKTMVEDEEGGEYPSYDYFQVRCYHPIDPVKIQEKIDTLNLDHKVEL